MIFELDLLIKKFLLFLTVGLLFPTLYNSIENVKKFPSNTKKKIVQRVVLAQLTILTILKSGNPFRKSRKFHHKLILDNLISLNMPKTYIVGQ